MCFFRNNMPFASFSAHDGWADLGSTGMPVGSVRAYTYAIATSLFHPCDFCYHRSSMCMRDRQRQGNPTIHDTR